MRLGITMNVYASEKCLRETIESFRESFRKLRPDEQRLAEEKGSGSSFLAPCQIEVLNFEGSETILWLVVHDDTASDMQFTFHTGIKRIEESDFAKKYTFPVDISRLSSTSFHGLTILTEDWCLSLSGAERHPTMLAQVMLSHLRETIRNEQVKTIERSTEGLKESITRVPEKQLREELLTNTGQIDTALKEIKRIDEDLGKVRQLVGTSKEYQDWKLLITDVDRLKGEHVPREVFDANIKELNTRIDSFKEIKDGYEKMLTQQTDFMKQQAGVMKQQSSFITWIKYATILLPIAVISVPIIEIIRYLLGMH
jgi:hypothetical protein